MTGCFGTNGLLEAFIFFLSSPPYLWETPSRRGVYGARGRSGNGMASPTKWKPERRSFLGRLRSPSNRTPSPPSTIFFLSRIEVGFELATLEGVVLICNFLGFDVICSLARMPAFFCSVPSFLFDLRTSKSHHVEDKP